mmetsp:Transcript_38954/g.63118  ORF Transcript_38954/g.63118 Transcript_38954/m.63118 type:complete len:215 (+) Transcript_38954:265-909(+)
MTGGGTSTGAGGGGGGGGGSVWVDAVSVVGAEGAGAVAGVLSWASDISSSASVGKLEAGMLEASLALNSGPLYPRFLAWVRQNNPAFKWIWFLSLRILCASFKVSSSFSTSVAFSVAFCSWALSSASCFSFSSAKALPCCFNCCSSMVSFRGTCGLIRVFFTVASSACTRAIAALASVFCWICMERFSVRRTLCSPDLASCSFSERISSDNLAC